MEDTFKNLKGFTVCLDDVLSFAKLTQELDEFLREVLERIK